MRTTQIHALCGGGSVLDASRPVSAVPRNQRGPKGALGQKFQFCHGEKFSMGLRPHLFLSSLLTQKSTFRAFLAKFESMFLRKVNFFVYPIWAQNGLFFGPEGPILTQNLKIIVYQVVITQNKAFQGLNWSQNDYVIFGFCRPPKTYPGPPRPPQWSRGAKNGRNSLVPVQC